MRFESLGHVKRIGGILLLAAATGVSGCGEATSHAVFSATRSESWTFAGLAGQCLQTDHYRIYTTSDNRMLLTRLPEFLEAAYRQYCTLTGLSAAGPGQKPMNVYLFATREQWALFTRQVTGPRSDVYLQIQNGGYSYQGTGVYWDLGNTATYSVAAHEGMHKFLFARLSDGLPAWAEEGLATQMEGFEIASDSVGFTPQRNNGRMNSLRNVVTSGKWIDLGKLLSTDAGDYVTGIGAPDYYAQLWALVLFLRGDERYRQGLERMVNDAAQGRLREWMRVPEQMGRGREYTRSIGLPVFRRYISPDLPAFGKQFHAFARKLAQMK
jgi:hypothetical protein